MVRIFSFCVTLFFITNAIFCQNLEVLDVQVQDPLLDIWGVSCDDIYAVGNNSTVLNYKGGSSNWEHIDIGASTNLRAIWGTSSDNIYVAGGPNLSIYSYIYHFNGNEWQEVYAGETGSIRAIWGTSEDNIYAISSNHIIQYNGAEWVDLKPASVSFYYYHLYDIWGTSENDIYVAGFSGSEDIIYHFNGSSWEYFYQAENSYFLHKIFGFAPDDIYAVGSSGITLHYDGVSWEEMVSASGEPLYGIWGLSSDNLWSVGGLYQGNGRLNHYDGTSWKEIKNYSQSYIYDIWGTSENNIYAVGSGGIGSGGFIAAYKNENSNSLVSIETCDSYVSPSGKFEWKASGIYTDVIKNVRTYPFYYSIHIYFLV